MMKRWFLPKTARSLLPLTMTILPHARAVPLVLLQRRPNTATSAAAHAVNSGTLLSSVRTRNLLHRFMPCRMNLMTHPHAVTPPVSLSSPRTTAVAPPSTRTSSSSIAKARSIFSPTLLTLTMLPSATSYPSSLQQGSFSGQQCRRFWFQQSICQQRWLRQRTLPLLASQETSYHLR